MSVRRGEVPFVAIRVGRSNDPREVLGLAQELKIPRAHALGYVALWEEFILEVGDAMTGRVKGYTAAHVAAKLGFTGRPARLIDALKRAGVLATQKGTFIHPTWLDSPTGAYAHRKADDRETWREQKAVQRAAARASQMQNNGADVSTESTWTGGGRPGGLRMDGGQKERKDVSGQPPQPPADAGGALGASRWRWVLDKHPRPTNPRGCMPYLGRMTEEEWALFQWVSGLPADGGPYKLSRKKRVLGWDSYKILSTGAYLQIRPEWVAKLEQEQRPKKNGAAKVIAVRDEQAEEAARLAHATAFILAQLDDPDLTDAKREAVKARFVSSHPGITPPWELS